MSTNSNLLKRFKPVTSGLRHARLLCHKNLVKKIKPLKGFNSGYCFGNGRNNTGQVTSWQRGGGHKRVYRKIDFVREHPQSSGLCQGFEYDPNRTPLINRLFNPDLHTQSYILGVKNLEVGDYVKNRSNYRIKIGDSPFLKDVPFGFVVHNLSTGLNKKAQYLRAAGAYGQVILKNTEEVRIKLRSGEHRLFSPEASATLGAVCNEHFRSMNTGKAGRNRWYGIRPSVRGVAINPVDHPHGGGEGRTSGGRPSVTPWGKPTKGQSKKPKTNPFRIVPRDKTKTKII